MVYSEQTSITNCSVLANTLINDLIAGGMKLVYPVVMTAQTYAATLTTTVDTDTAATSDIQRWSIRIEALSSVILRVIVGTSVQLPISGSFISNPDGTIPGHIGSGTSNYVYFIDRSAYTSSQQLVKPMNYSLICAPQGIALGIWEELTDNLSPPIFSYFVIQRPVNNRTGVIRTTGKAPVYCIYGINTAKTSITNKMVVRETDILLPSVPVDATIDSADSCRVINNKQMVSITEDNSYVVFFPNNLNTVRYAYPQDDLDLIAYTSADLIAQGSLSLFKVYGETNCRSYKGLVANGANNTNMRILILTI